MIFKRLLLLFFVSGTTFLCWSGTTLFFRDAINSYTELHHSNKRDFLCSKASELFCYLPLHKIWYDVLETPYEIIQSFLRSAKAQEHSLKEHGNLTYSPSYWLHEGKFARKIAQAVIVRRHRDDSYRGTYISVQFWRRQKLSESFKRVQNIQFTMEETQGLLTGFQATRTFAFLEWNWRSSSRPEGTYHPSVRKGKR